MLYIPNDSWRSKGKRKTKNYLEKDSWERVRNKAGWKSWEVAKAVAQDWNCWPDSMKALCAYTGAMRHDDDEKCWHWTRSTNRVMRKRVKMRWPVWNRGGKKWEVRVWRGGEVKFYIIYCKWFRMNHLHFDYWMSQEHVWYCRKPDRGNPKQSKELTAGNHVLQGEVCIKRGIFI